MTSVEHRAERMPDIGEAQQARFPWLATVIVLLLAAIGLTTWVVYDRATEDSVPGEIQQLLDDYLAAWEMKDETALRQSVTDEYVINEYIYLDYKTGTRRGVHLYEHVVDDVFGVIAVGLTFDWENEQVGSATVTGENPWIVSVDENWMYKDRLYEGTANYVVVEEDGDLKITNHYWAGLLSITSVD